MLFAKVVLGAALGAGALFSAHTPASPVEPTAQSSTGHAAPWPGTVPGPGLLPGEPDELVAQVALAAGPVTTDGRAGDVIAFSPADGHRISVLAPWEPGGGVTPYFVTHAGTIVGVVGEGMGSGGFAWGVGLVPASGKPRVKTLDIPCSTHKGLALSPDGERLLWLVGGCSRPLNQSPVLDEFDLSGKKVAVSSPDGAISPRSWGGPGGAYVTGYLPPPKGAPEPFGPIGAARIGADGTISRPIAIGTTDRGCQLTSPVFVPGSGDIASVEDCDVHVLGDGNEWATSARVLRVDPTTGRVVGVIALLPPGLDIGEPEFDSSGSWIVFGASTNNAQGTAEGDFILHNGRCWRVPDTGSLDGAIWR